MDFKPTLGKYTVYASEYCHMDSHIVNGGGTDDTDILQAILDLAPVWGHLHLIVDGVALIRGMRVHSNTTIECLDSDCGFYLADGSNTCVARNANWTTGEIIDKNITFRGGTYNQNNLNQDMNFNDDEVFPPNEGCNCMLTGMKFFGVENFVMENVTIENNKRYALIMGNWKDVVFNNINIPTTNLVPHTNQDGLHFHSPGQNLQIRNIHGRGCDDFIALNTDEGDGKTSIKGVVIDGVYLDDTYQGIRLLTKGEGVLEDVSIKNVFGTIRAFGFYINQWTGDAKGLFKNISIENVFLKHKDHVYDYARPFAFFLGGFIDNLTVKNLSVESDHKDFNIVRISNGAAPGNNEGWWSPTHVKNMTIDGLYAVDNNDTAKDWFHIEDDIDVDRLVIKNAILKTAGKTEGLVYIDEPARVKEINFNDVTAEGFEKLIIGKCDKVTNN